MNQVRHIKRAVAGLALSVAVLAAVAAPPVPVTPRDYRAVWCATVTNIDWPAAAGTSVNTVNAQKARLIQHLDAMVAAKMNAMYFQVRPACDAMYISTIEPPSQWLTGSQTTPMTYDPLAFAVTEAHKRGIELHAWVNPYRAALDQRTDNKAPNHVTRLRPDLCKTYTDGRTYMDPGKDGTITWIIDVIEDIVTRYDVDGVVFDDYFYPGTDFNDSATYQAYVNGGGTLSLSNWRRNNVDRLIQGCYNAVHGIRQSCQFEVGPFGIWQPGFPTGVTGANYYTTHYCDTRKWLQMGWVDSLSPQLYWPTDSPGQPFGALIDWWIAQNPNRHVLASTADYRVGNATFDTSGNVWSTKTAAEIVSQVNRVAQGGGEGTVHYSMKWLTDNPAGVHTALIAGPYAKDALKPASTWLDNVPPPAPSVTFGPATGSPPKRTVSFTQNPLAEKANWWCVHMWNGSAWSLKVLPSASTSYQVDPVITEVAVSAVDRVGNESARTQTTAIDEWTLY